MGNARALGKWSLNGGDDFWSVEAASLTTTTSHIA